MLDVKDHARQLKREIENSNSTLDTVCFMMTAVNDRRPEVTIFELIEMVRALKQ